MLWKALLVLSLASNALLWWWAIGLRELVRALVLAHVGPRAHDAMVINTSSLPEILAAAGEDSREKEERALKGTVSEMNRRLKSYLPPRQK